MVVLKTDDGVYGEGEARGVEERGGKRRRGKGRDVFSSITLMRSSYYE